MHTLQKRQFLKHTKRTETHSPTEKSKLHWDSLVLWNTVTSKLRCERFYKTVL